MKKAKKNMDNIEEIDSINKVTLMGEVVDDVKYTRISKNNAVFKFRLRTKFTRLDPIDNSKRWCLDSHKVVVWGTLAEMCRRNIKKGDKVYVEGKVHTRYYLENVEGICNFTTEIYGDVVKLLIE